MLESTQAIQVSRATDKGSHCVIELPLRSAVSVYGFASRTEGKQKRRLKDVWWLVGWIGGRSYALFFGIMYADIMPEIIDL
jgi:hypothetical protein